MQDTDSRESKNPKRSTLSEGEEGRRVVLSEVTNIRRVGDRQVQSKIRWEWNLPYLATSSLIVCVVVVVAVIVHAFQARRVAEGLSSRAKKAMAQEDFINEAKWLSQLIAFDHLYDRALERYAVSMNHSVDSPEKAFKAKNALLKAMASLDESADHEQLQKLRRLLIERLVEMRGNEAFDAEKQVLLLKADRDDRDALRWLAISLFVQVENGEWRVRDKARFDQQKDYWGWLSCQPVGQVLEAAEASNPDSIDLKIALLSAYVDRAELFDVTLDDASRRDLHHRAQRVIDQLQLFDDGRAQFACVTLAERMNPDASRKLLSEITGRAIDRLHAPKEVNAKTVYKGVQPPSRYWDMAIAMAEASKLDIAGKYADADAIMQQLVTLDKDLIPESQYAELYLQFAKSKWRRGEYDSVLETLRKGCEEVNYNSGLELWEMIAAIQCSKDTPEQAIHAIDDLDEVIRKTQEFYLSNPLRDGFRERELQRLAKVRWHSAYLRSELTLRSISNWDSIQELTKLLQTQVAIPSDLRVRATLQLANAYAKSEFWDLEARVLEDAIELAPDDKILRKRAADAWVRAGVLSRAESQLKLADDGSFDSALSYLQVLLENQRAVLPAQRQVDRVRNAENQARQRLVKAKAAGEVCAREWLFEVIEATNAIDALEPSVIDVRLQSDQGLVRLVHAHSDNAELQAMAARTFAAIGNDNDAAAALENLERLRESAPRIWFETQLQVYLQKKQFELAQEFFQRAMNEALLPKLELRRITAKAFADAGDIEEAYNILAPEKDNADIPYLLDFARKIMQLPLVATGDSDNSEPSSVYRLSEFDELVTNVQKLEGPGGNIGLYLEAAKQARSFESSKLPDELKQAEATIKRVLEARPRWIDALKLAGDISATKGDAVEAATFYQQAIAAGDTRVTTVFLLAQQLNQSGRFSEAEYEFQRISQLSPYSRAISGFAIGLELRKGNYQIVHEMAKAATERHPKDPYAWLLRSQAALTQQASIVTSSTELLDEAERCLVQANELSGGNDVSIWIAQIRFCARFRSPSATQSLIEALEKSPVSMKSRGMLTAQAYTGLQDYTSAIDTLKDTLKKLPSDIDLWVAIAECYRLSGQPNQALESLEKAYRLNPKRDDVARSLAFMLATHNTPGLTVPWERIESIVERIESRSTDAKNFLYTVLLVARGSAEQRAQALRLLNDLIQSSDPKVAEDSLRLSIGIHRQAWEEAQRTNRREKILDSQREIQRLFGILWKSAEKVHLANDLFQYTDLLLQAGELTQVHGQLDEFERIAPNNPQLLNLRFRTALAEGKEKSLPQLVAQWVGNAKELRNSAILAEAGRLLSEHNMLQESLPYLKSAYDLDSQWFRALIVGMARAGQLNDSLELCVKRYTIEPNIETISLLTDVAILNIGRSPLDPRIDQIIQESLDRFPRSLRLFELVGTLRLFEHRFEEAVILLLRAEAISPNSLMTLNNLAIAASELPGREREGLARIERAIELYGRSPELLDTLGIVQLYCGFADKAEASLMASWNEKPDSRTLLHLIQALAVQGKHEAIGQQLRHFKISDLQGITLLPREQQALEMHVPPSMRLPPSKESL